MIDIEHLTLCKDYDCPLRESCIRYMQPARQDSLFFAESPRKKWTTECVQFLQYLSNLDTFIKPPKKEVPRREIKPKNILIKKEGK